MHPPKASCDFLAGASVRIAQLAELLEKLGCNVHFVSIRTFYFSMEVDDIEMKSHYGNRYHAINNGQLCKGTFLNRLWMKLLILGLKNYKIGQDTFWTNQIFTKQNKTALTNIVETINPDVIITEYAVLAPLVSQLNDGSIKVVDTHDLFTDRNKKIRASGGEGAWINLTENQERSLLSNFDHVLAIQSEEQQYFEELLGSQSAKVKLVDILEVPEIDHTKIKFAKVIGFIGSNSINNLEGLKLFIDIHWQKIISKIPDATLLIAGSVAYESNVTGVRHLGRVSDIKVDFYDKCSLIINPCLSGSGLKIKTVEAMAYALPVVATPEGASGIMEDAGHGLQVEDLHADQFHEACITLLSDEENNRKAGLNARSKILKRFARTKDTLKRVLLN